MLMSLSALFHLVTLPYRLAYLTIQFYTVGTVFTNPQAKKSLIKTLHLGMLQYMGRSLRKEDVKFSYVSVADLLQKHKPSFGHLPGYGRVFSEKGIFTCDTFWLTNAIEDKDSPIVLYLHGGCFAMQLLDDQLRGMANLYEAYQKRYGKKLSILLADYSLTVNNATYPTQINEIVSAYEKLVDEGFKNIAILGDSAGGSLVVNLLLHLELKARLAPVTWPTAAVAISPYLNVSKQEFKGSFEKNNFLDFFNYDMSQYFGNLYIGGDKWLDKSVQVNSELNADLVDWQSIPTIRDGKLLVNFGENEVLADEILRWCQKTGIKDRHPENIALDIHGVHIGLFSTDSTAYNTIDQWQEQFNADAVLTFLHKKFPH